MDYEAIWRIIFFLVGLFSMGLSIRQFLNSLKFVRTGQRTIGKVVGFREKPDEDGDKVYFPIVRFDAPSGKTEFESEMGRSTSKYKVGDSVKVIFEPTNPRKAEIEAFSAIWGFTLGSFIFGLVFLLAGLYSLFGGEMGTDYESFLRSLTNNRFG